MNIGIVGPPWDPLQPKPPGWSSSLPWDTGTPSQIALRVGIDVEALAVDFAGWSDFYSRTATWALDSIGASMDDVAIVVDAR